MPLNPPIRVFKADPLAAPKRRPASATGDKNPLRNKPLAEPLDKPNSPPASLPSATDLMERRKSVRSIPAPVAEEIDMSQAMKLWGQSRKAK